MWRCTRCDVYRDNKDRYTLHDFLLPDTMLAHQASKIWNLVARTGPTAPKRRSASGPVLMLRPEICNKMRGWPNGNSKLQK